jgi:hypothetical protein
MSARDSSEPAIKLSLALVLLLGPIIALAAQSAIYAATSWTCGRDIGATMHIIPALALIISVGSGITAYLHYRDAGKGLEDEHGGPTTRIRFIGMIGMGLSAFSSLVILAMWASIFVFAPCMRA